MPPWCDKCKRHLRIDEQVHEHDNYDSPNLHDYPVLVIGTTNEAAKEYAELLRLENYITENSIDKIQGLRMRGIVMTPAYVYSIRRASWELEAPFDAAYQGFIMATGKAG